MEIDLLNDSEVAFARGLLCGPHCDSRIMHAPGECIHCDAFPLGQKYRLIWGINYTGHIDPEKSPCPATIARPIEDIERWPGNRKKNK